MFELCPKCQAAKRVAARCLTCGFLAVAALDPHAHTHTEKYTPAATRSVTVVASTSTSSSSFNGGTFTVNGWPKPT